MTRRQDDPRQRLISTAADLLRRRGLSSTSIRELSKCAKAPLGSTYHYFPGGKPQLIGEAVTQTGQHIGKLLVLWRPTPEVTKERSEDEERGAGPRDFKVLKYSKRGGQRPEVKTLRVLGNQRLTPGGQVKRAKKPKQTSVKKRSQT